MSTANTTALTFPDSQLDGARVGYQAGYLPLAVSVFANRPHVRAQMADDAAAAGFRLAAHGAVSALIEDVEPSMGEVILIDAPVVEAAALAALTRIDLAAARAGASLVVSTSIAALDDVFGCLDQSGAQILVAPSRAERVIALGRVLGAMPRGRVRELSEEDRLTLLRLTEQVGQIALRLDRLAPAGPATPDVDRGGAFRFESPATAWNNAPSDDGSARLVRAPRPALPDPRLVRRVIRQRQSRASSRATCSPIRRGTCCSTSPPRAPSIRAYLSPRCASPAACPRPPRCAGSG